MTSTTTALAPHVQSLIEASPDWLADLRREAWEAYTSLDYPEGREEFWRFTDTKALHPDGFTPAACGVPTLGLSDEARAAGVVLTDMATALTEHAEILRPRLGSLVGADEPHRALSLAGFDDGTFLYVPKGTRLTEPITAAHTLDAAGALALSRTLVVIEDDCDVVFTDLYRSSTLSSPTLAIPATEVFVGAGSRAGWVTWQDWGSGVRHIAHMKAHLDRDAHLDSLLVTLGGDFSRTWKEVTMAGQGGHANLYGLSFSRSDQHIEHWTVQDHVAPHCTSDLLYKSALDDTSQVLYYGTIRIRPGAFRSDAYQKNQNLALSEHARALPNPQLEIENNDVRCTHGATVGQIDETHLFYLRSRGIPEDEARRLVVFGFFNQVLEKVEWSGLTDPLAAAITEKMEA